MKIIQLKWSDEAGWKDHIPVEDETRMEYELEQVEVQWRADQLKHSLGYDATFRVIDVLIGDNDCARHPTTAARTRLRG